MTQARKFAWWMSHKTCDLRLYTERRGGVVGGGDCTSLEQHQLFFMFCVLLNPSKDSKRAIHAQI